MAQAPFDQLYHKADICDGLTRPPFTLAENVRRLASLPLVHQPGSAAQYSLSTDVLGRLVEVISGQDLESFMRSRIFQPLGMNDTYFDLPADKTGRLAVRSGARISRGCALRRRSTVISQASRRVRQPRCCGMAGP
jgi:CubicO group peptidase (beta-lactamase class C family)